MKTLLAIMGIVGLVSCTPQKTERVSILVDVTEAVTPQVTINDTNKIGYPKDLWDGSIVRYSLLKDVHHTQVKEFIIPAQNEWESNTLNRKKDVQEFKNQLRNLGHDDTLEYAYSSIWKPLMDELLYLSQEPIPTKVYLVSDLMEHVPESISLYDAKTIQNLEQNPEVLRERFQVLVPSLPSCGHISLVVVHDPKDIQASITFTRIYEEVYVPILSEKGIICTVQAKL